MTDSKADVCLLSILNRSCEHLMMAIYVIYNTFRDFNDKSSYAGSVLQAYHRFNNVFLYLLIHGPRLTSSVLIIQPHKRSSEFSISIYPIHIKNILNLTKMSETSSFCCY